MIANIKAQSVITPVATSSTSTADIPSSVPAFEEFIPALTTRFRKAVISLPEWHDKSDAVAEMIGIAFTLYASMVRRGRTDIFWTPLAEYSVKHYFSGRRVCGMSATDASSDRCQLLGRAGMTNNPMSDMIICKKTFRPSTIACFNIDYEAWVDSLDARMREILFAILDGETTGDLAKRLGLSFGRISQIRRMLIDKWHEFTADRPDKDEE